MRNSLATFLILVVLMPLAAGVHARPPGAGGDADSLPPGALYRFRSADGNLMISSVLPEQAIQSGYEVIDNRGRVLKVVDPAIPEEERFKMREEMRIRHQDTQLRRLYPTPADAERARDRQTSSFRLGIDYARGIINQLDSKLAEEVAKAAAAERAGKPVPEVVQGNIDLYTRQIREQEEKIAEFEQDIIAVGEDFAPIISRLKAIDDSK
ncbi:MAG: hypothetical protein P1U78_00395 [Alcanivoracaceae bacterium]|nr:hypothetical protein [Alcanivoracaceae bacterium]